MLYFCSTAGKSRYQQNAWIHLAPLAQYYLELFGFQCNHMYKVNISWFRFKFKLSRKRCKSIKLLNGGTKKDLAAIAMWGRTPGNNTNVLKGEVQRNSAAPTSCSKWCRCIKQWTNFFMEFITFVWDLDVLFAFSALIRWLSLLWLTSTERSKPMTVFKTIHVQRPPDQRVENQSNWMLKQLFLTFHTSKLY